MQQSNKFERSSKVFYSFPTWRTPGRPVLGSLSETLVYHGVFQFVSIVLNSGRGWIRARVANWIVGIQANTSLSNYSVGQSHALRLLQHLVVGFNPTIFICGYLLYVFLRCWRSAFASVYKYSGERVGSGFIK